MHIHRNMVVVGSSPDEDSSSVSFQALSAMDVLLRLAICSHIHVHTQCMCTYCKVHVYTYLVANGNRVSVRAPADVDVFSFGVDCVRRFAG